ncbi:MAG: DUF2513 domain-containing protein [Candidatus Latescibacteria bacterium]|nr:DUF2513 domain-containing protein [Candidatus Latescibacterota bacterium]
MKRDMDLVRGILLAIEEKETLGDCDFCEVLDWLRANKYITSSDKDRDKVSAHCGILVDGGLAEKCYDFMETDASRQDKWFFFPSSRIRLCWEGYEFLDNARQDKLWEQVKDKIDNAGGTLSFEITSCVTSRSKVK